MLHCKQKGTHLSKRSLAQYFKQLELGRVSLFTAFPYMMSDGDLLIRPVIL